MTKVMSDLAQTASQVRVVTLDGARPIPGSVSAVDVSQGLIPLDPPAATTSACRPKSTTSRRRRNRATPTTPTPSPSSAPLQQPFVDVDSTMRQVRVAAHQATGGEQTPWHATNPTTPPFAFVLNADPAQAQALSANLPSGAGPLDGLDPEAAYWAAIWRNTIADYQNFLDAFGTPRRRTGSPASAAAGAVRGPTRLAGARRLPAPVTPAPAPSPGRLHCSVSLSFCPGGFSRLRRLPPPCIPWHWAAACRRADVCVPWHPGCPGRPSCIPWHPGCPIPLPPCIPWHPGCPFRRRASRGIQAAGPPSCIPWHPGCPGGRPACRGIRAARRPRHLRSVASGLPGPDASCVPWHPGCPSAASSASPWHQGCPGPRRRMRAVASGLPGPPAPSACRGIRVARASGQSACRGIRAVRAGRCCIRRTRCRTPSARRLAREGRRGAAAARRARPPQVENLAGGRFASAEAPGAATSLRIGRAKRGDCRSRTAVAPRAARCSCLPVHPCYCPAFTRGRTPGQPAGARVRTTNCNLA